MNSQESATGFVNYISASLAHSFSHIFRFHYVLCTLLLLLKGWMFAFMSRVNLKEEFILERITCPLQHHNHHTHMSCTTSCILSLLQLTILPSFRSIGLLWVSLLFVCCSSNRYVSCVIAYQKPSCPVKSMITIYHYDVALGALWQTCS